MKKIQLTQGKFALVDDPDFEWLNQWKWTVMKKGSRSVGFYAYRKNYGKKTDPGRPDGAMILMHKLIMQTPSGSDTDHIDNDGFNNQRVNLRVISRTQNNFNSGIHVNNSSGHRGVSWSRNARLWRAYIGGSKTRRELGYFKDISEAIVARKNAEAEEIICA